MKRSHIFEADDGTTFETAAACKAHEERQYLAERISRLLPSQILDALNARVSCVLAQAVAVVRSRGLYWEDLHPVTQQIILDEQTAAFDALATVPVRVNLPEATEEMIDAARRAHYSADMENIDFRLWRAMSAAGNLVNPQEKK